MPKSGTPGAGSGSSPRPDLRERELIKLATRSAALAGRLRDRGVSEPAATLAAETGVAAFRVAFERWCESDDGSSYGVELDASLGQLRALLKGDG